jgi:hypothetical protein
MFLQDQQSSGEFVLVASDYLSDQRGMLVDAAVVEELVNYPISHFIVIGRDGNEGGFNQVLLDCDQRSQLVEGLLHLLNGLTLVGDHLQDG